MARENIKEIMEGMDFYHLYRTKSGRKKKTTLINECVIITRVISLGNQPSPNDQPFIVQRSPTKWCAIIYHNPPISSYNVCYVHLHHIYIHVPLYNDTVFI